MTLPPNEAPTVEVGELVERLRHLVSLNAPHSGGPYGGYAAAQCMSAMTEAASALTAANADRDRLEKELAAALKDGAVQFETSLSHEERAETLARELEEAREALKLVRPCVEGYIDRCDFTKGNKVLAALDAALASGEAP